MAGMARELALVVALVALLSCKSKDDAPPPSSSASPVASDPCAHPVPITIGVQTEGDLGARTQCWRFDGLANVALLLDVEVRSEAPVDVAVLESGNEVCHASVDTKSASWGKPRRIECAIPKSGMYNLRMRGAGAYRFTLRRRD
jgi:hypothetical protein